MLGSLPFDWALRRRLTGTNLNGFVLADCVVPRLDGVTLVTLAQIALQLCALLPWHGAIWQLAATEGWSDRSLRPAWTRELRQDLFARLDSVVSTAFGLTAHDVAWITNDDGPRGFRRVDEDLPPAQRRPMRWLAAFARDDAQA